MHKCKTSAPESAHAMLPVFAPPPPPACALPPHVVRARRPHTHAHPRLHASCVFTGSDIALLCIWGLYMLQLVHAALEEF